MVNPQEAEMNKKNLVQGRWGVHFLQHLIIVSRILPLSTQNIPSYTHGDFSALHGGLKRVVAGKEFGFAWRIDMSTLSSVDSGLLIVSSASLWTAS
jgi:hypothetical protein